MQNSSVNRIIGFGADCQADGSELPMQGIGTPDNHYVD
jgi:hypothetical protein